MTDQGGKFCGASPARMKTSSGELDAHYDAGMTSSPKRVMCLMSDTGGGHRASAVALKDAFEALYGAYTRNSGALIRPAPLRLNIPFYVECRRR